MTDKKKHPHENVEPEETGAGPASQEAAQAAPAPDELRAELEKANAQAAEYLDGWKRAQAELANYRKRVERDSAEARIAAIGRAAARWFPVLDDFDRALKERAAAANWEQWAAGVELIYRKGVAALQAEGVEPFDAPAGAEFNPELYEAVTMEPDPEKQDGEILGTVRCGYRLGERVLRPAQVRVACRPAENTAGGEEKKS